MYGGGEKNIDFAIPIRVHVTYQTTFMTSQRVHCSWHVSLPTAWPNRRQQWPLIHKRCYVLECDGSSRDVIQRNMPRPNRVPSPVISAVVPRFHTRINTVAS